MHVPDGFLDVPTSVATGVVSAAAIAVALKKSRNELDERTAPMAGLTAAFVFAVQMLNFPVGVGTSGHLMGGALAAVLVGPWTAVLVLSVVLAVQALVFADGGLTALGTNILLMGIVTVAVGWTVTRLMLRVLPKRPRSVVPASFVGALLSVPAAAAVFVLLYRVGGATELPFGALLATMLGWHTLIGIGEAVITSATVGAVLAVRPDLVFAARGMQPDLVLKGADGRAIGTAPQQLPGEATPGVPASPSAHSPWPLVAAGLGVTLVAAGLLSFFASSHPDGLEYVAGNTGFLEQAQDSAVGGFLLADYGEVGGVPVGVAGLIGVGLTILLGLGLFRWLARRSAPEQPAQPPASARV
jgi:cobalt/nickel transport system permease protein